MSLPAAAFGDYPAQIDHIQSGPQRSISVAFRYRPRPSHLVRASRKVD
jgi:hypothetical protein